MVNVQLVFSLTFQKGCDTVDHDILFNKLYNYGITGIALEWFKSYVSNRYQIVKYNDYESEKYCVESHRVYIRPTFISGLYKRFTFGLQWPLLLTWFKFNLSMDK